MSKQAKAAYGMNKMALLVMITAFPSVELKIGSYTNEIAVKLNGSAQKHITFGKLCAPVTRCYERGRILQLCLNNFENFVFY